MIDRGLSSSIKPFALREGDATCSLRSRQPAGDAWPEPALQDNQAGRATSAPHAAHIRAREVRRGFPQEEQGAPY
jgi:hypothetical protein